MSWKEISNDTYVEPNNTYQSISTYHRTSGESTDSYIIHGLETAVSYTELKEQIENTLGIGVTIISVRAKKIDNNLYEQIIEFKCIHAGNPVWIPIAYVAVKFGLIFATALVIYFTIDRLSRVVEEDHFKIKVGDIEANLFPIVIIAIIILVILFLMRR